MIGWFSCWLLATGCATRPTPPPPAPAPYTRIGRPDADTLRLEIAARRFVPDRRRGPAVWLVGVSHIGEPGYYHELQTLLDAQTLVLFEGVNADSHARRVRGAAPVADDSASAGAPEAESKVDPGLQSTLARSLGLVFQLEAIDYDHTNFLNSDLSIQEIAALINGAPPLPASGGASGGQGGGTPRAGNASFSYLLQAMDGNSALGALMKLAVQFIGSSPHLQSITRVMFIELLGQLGDQLPTLQNVPADMRQMLQVLIEARNRAVLSDLKTEFPHVPRNGSIAIFYGTGHMTDLETRLRREFHYHPDTERWFTAFSVNAGQAGLSAGEMQMIRNMVQWEINLIKNGTLQ